MVGHRMRIRNGDTSKADVHKWLVGFASLAHESQERLWCHPAVVWVVKEPTNEGALARLLTTERFVCGRETYYPHSILLSLQSNGLGTTAYTVRCT
jgi:hypothetical protein